MSHSIQVFPWNENGVEATFATWVDVCYLDTFSFAPTSCRI